MNRSVDIKLGPVDPLNPGCGYQIHITVNGLSALFTSTHPGTGAALDLNTCLEVAAMYRDEGGGK